MTDPETPLPSARPTLRTIAYLAGLGVSTVSRALKDGSEISQETRARVKLIAQQIGYRPNRAGVRLRTGKTNVIALVLNAEQDGNSTGFFSDFVYGVSEWLKDTSYHLVITPYSLHDPMEPIRYLVETGSADGVIISRIEPSDPRVRYLVDNKMPFATHGRTDMGIDHAYHDYDNEGFAFEAVRALKDRGRSRLTLLGPPRDLTYSIHTQRGFERGVSEFGVQTIPYGSNDIDLPIGQLRDAARHLAQQDHRPDGIVCSSMTASFAMAAGFQDAGLSMGRDFDVVTKHTTEFAKLFNPSIISIPEDFRFAGRDLAEKLVALLDGAAASTLQHVERPTLT